MGYDIHHIISQSTIEAVEKLFGDSIPDTQIQLQKTRKEFEGDITLVVFPLTKISKKGPEQTADAIGNYLKEHIQDVQGFNVVKGFLNISMSQNFWLGFFEESLKNERFGFEMQDIKPRVIVEYASPNTNKPLHLGHLRNIFLGFSVANILKAVGHRITRVQIINDRGIHICKSMVAWMKFGNNETPESSGMKGDKLVGHYYVLFDKEYKMQVAELVSKGFSEEDAKKNAPIMMEAQELLRKWEAKDDATIALWKKMNLWVYSGFDFTYKTMAVDFDKLYYESDTYLLGRDEVLKGVEQKVFEQLEDGSIWVNLEDEGLDKKALLRKDGTAMYITQDIGTAILRFKDFPDTAYQIYTVGNEQEYHFKVLFKILKRLGFAQADQNFHLSYGMVELPEGKMKSREGTAVDADDIMLDMANEAKAVAAEQGKLEGLPDDEKEELYNTIGMAALKYFLLRVDAKKNMQFNPKESIDFNGNTGPSIQYTYVRTQAVLRKFGELTNWRFGDLSANQAELSIVKRIYEFPEFLREAAATYNPALIAHYCYDLARDYNSFYHDNPILREAHQELKLFRVALTAKTGLVLKHAMQLLGVQMPERM
ncbi:MAG: arginine--tRNA ligase [Flavobacteriales bacterium]|nr:arginine--tRNA ligase [Flavobacteriales bacterium]